MSRTTLILSSIFLVLVLPVIMIHHSLAQSLSPFTSQQPTTYSNSTLGIQINIPSGWSEKDFATSNGGKGLNFSSATNTSFFMVNVTDNRNDNRTISQLVDSLKKSIQNVTRENLITFAGLPAYQVISWKQVSDAKELGDTKLKVTDVITTNKNKTYHIRYGAHAEERQAFTAFKDMVATFKITDSNNINKAQRSEQLSSFVPSPQSPQYYPTPQTSPLYQLPSQQTIQPSIVAPRILNENNYIDSYGTLHIVGEVINESYEPMRFVQVTATYYDANNRVVGTSFDYTSPSSLQPGQRAPFDITASERSMPTYLISSYTLSADYSSWLR